MRKTVLFSVLLFAVLSIVTSQSLQVVDGLSDKKALKKINKELKDIPGKVENIDSIIAFEDDEIYDIWGDGINLPDLEEICNDGLDNDLDGLTDEECNPNNVEICSNGIDDNNNGQIDENCPTEEICGDGIDNNLNGKIDENCQEICKDGIDNNNNGKIDENCPVDDENNTSNLVVLNGTLTEAILMGDWGDTSNTKKNLDNINSIPNNPNLLLGLGDYYYDSEDKDDWKSKYVDKINVEKKHYALGNHEPESYIKELGQDSVNTVTSINNVEVIDLTTTLDGVSLADQEDLVVNAFSGNNESVFEIVTMHKTPLTLKSKHSSEDGYQEALCNMIAKVDIDLIAAAHNHNLQESVLLKCDENGKWVVSQDPNDPKSFYFILVGGGGRDLYSMSGSNELISVSSKSFGFIDLQVSENQALMQYVQSDGSIKYPLLWNFN